MILPHAIYFATRLLDVWHESCGPSMIHSVASKTAAIPDLTDKVCNVWVFYAPYNRCSM